MSMLLICFIGTFVVLLEATWLHQVAIFEIIPNLSLIFVVHWSILRGSINGRQFGLWIGFLEDFLFHEIVGFYGLIYYNIFNSIIIDFFSPFCSDNLQQSDRQ